MIVCNHLKLIVCVGLMTKVTCTNHHHSTLERFDFQKNKSLRKERLNGRWSCGLKANQAQGSAEGISVVQEKEVNNQTGN